MKTAPRDPVHKNRDWVPKRAFEKNSQNIAAVGRLIKHEFSITKMAVECARNTRLQKRCCAPDVKSWCCMVLDLISECNDAMCQEKLEFQYKRVSRYRISLSMLNSNVKLRTVQYNLVSAETAGLEPGRASDLSHFMRAAKPNGTEKREPVHKNRNCVPKRAAVGRHP